MTLGYAMKECISCGERKELLEFHKRKDTKDGYRKECKSCRNNKAKDAYYKNPEKKKEYRERNSEKIAKRMFDYYNSNKDNVLTQQKRYRASQQGKAISQKVEAQRYLQVKSTRDGSITSETLEMLYEAQNGECYICGCDLTQLKRRNQHLDHIVPLSKGGNHILNNVAWSCASCNFKKSNNI